MCSSFDLNVKQAHIKIYGNRSYLKNRILAQGQGGLEFQPGGIL
jgi:hypothetical protein